MKLAFLYAGQGTQQVGMGRDLYEAYPAFRNILDSAPVDFDLKKLCFEGPEEALSDTRYTQPAMVAFAAGVTALLYEAGIRPQAAAWGSTPPSTPPRCSPPPRLSLWPPFGAPPWPTRYRAAPAAWRRY